MHTIVISDLHLSDAEPINLKQPLWKKFRQKQYFIDQEFKNFIDKLNSEISSPKELILNGDIFDFDSVMSLPEDDSISFNHHESKRGLSSTEVKSTFKIQKILEDHHLWLQSLARFLSNDNKIIFIIGNHDVELHWPQVQKKIISMMNIDEDLKKNIIFCEWFYISNQDTLIEHGNQYDPYCVCANPINPTISKRKEEIIRLPFGNLANKYLVNGMGLKNPHDDNAFIMDVVGFAKFFFKYEFKIQPFLFLIWFTGAIRTFFVYMSESWHPALRDPLTMEKKISKMAKKAQSSVEQLRLVKEFHAHPAAFKPFSVIRELWLDRILLLLIIISVSFQFFSTTNLILNVSIWWFIIPFIIALPFFTLYAQSVSSDVRSYAKKSKIKMAEVAHALKLDRVIQGHTHLLYHGKVNEIELINTGSWTPVFHDPECTLPYGKMPFAWIRPNEGKRTSKLYLFKNGEFVVTTPTQ